MSLRTIVFLVFAVVLAVGTALLAPVLLGGKTPQPIVRAAKAPDIHVLVAAADISTGAFVRARHLKWQVWPKAGLVDGYAIKGKRALKDFIGAVARAPIAAGEAITDTRLVQSGERGFLAAVLEPGFRAITVPVDATTGISGFVSPGDRVDVIPTVKFRSREEEEASQIRYLSETLLRSIRVLAIDQKVETNGDKIKPLKTVTLEVTPKMVEKVALGLKMGSISLSLQSLARLNGSDTTAISSALKLPERSFTMDSEIYFMFGPADRGAVKAKQTINILRGRKAEAVKF